MAIELEDTLHADGSLEMAADKLRVAAALQAKVAAPMAVAEEGVLVGTRPTINFVGTAVTAADNAGANRVDVTVNAPAPAAETDWADSGHADNLNFDGTPNVLPPGLTIFNGSGTSATVGTTPTVNPPTFGTLNPRVAVPVSGNDGSKIRCDVNSLRPKWLFYQAPNEATGASPASRFFVGKKWSVPATANMMLMVRYQTQQTGNISANPGTLQSFHGRFIFYVCKDAAGVPDFSTIVSINWAPRTSVDGSGDLYAYTVNGAGNGAVVGGTSLSLIAPSVAYVAPVFEWFWLHKVGLDWVIYGANSKSSNLALLGTVSFTSAWTPAWWGWVQNMGNGSPINPALGFKHLWRYDNAQPIY